MNRFSEGVMYFCIALVVCTAMICARGCQKDEYDYKLKQKEMENKK